MYLDSWIFGVKKSKVKVGHSKLRQMTPKPGHYSMHVNIWAVFTKIKSQMYLGLGHTD